MATVDNLEIQIEGSAKKANDAIDSLIQNLGKLANSLNIDTSKLSNIGKSLNFNTIEKASKSIQSQTQKVTKSLQQMEEKYKGLGKNFEIKGSTQQIQKEIDSLTNKLEKAKLAKKDFELSGKTNLSGYETAVKNVIKLNNQIKSLKNQIKETENTELKLDFGKTETQMPTKFLVEYKKQLADFKNDIQSIGDVYGGILNISKGGLDTPIENLKKSIEQLKQSYLQATNVIDAFESELQSLQVVSANLTKERIEPEINTSQFNKIDEAKEKTRNFKQVLNSLKDIQPQINETNLTKLQNRLKTVEEQTEKLRYELEKGLRFGTIEVDDKKFNDLTIKIKESENEAEALRKKIQEVGDASKKSNSFNILSSGADKTSNAFQNLSGVSKKTANSLNKMSMGFKNLLKTVLPFLGIRELFRWGKNAVETASGLTEVQNVVDTTFGDFKDKMEDLSKVSITDYGMSELTAKQIGSRFQAMGTAMGFSQEKMSDMSIELTKLSADMASFYNVEQEDVAKSLQSVFSGTTMPLRKYGLDLTQATLQEWAMKNGLDANIQSMSQAEKTMLRYQYVLANTKAAQGDFARTVDTWANQVRILKQNLQQLASIIGKTLINALKPLVKALNVAMGHLINFAKVVSNSLGKIFGWTYEESGGGIATDFEDAEDAVGGIADGLGQAAGNAKKLKQQLQGFDELNVLNIDDDALSGGGASGTGGTGGLPGAGAAGGEWKKTDSILKAYESELDTLYKLGTSISARLSATMESIDWNTVYEKARGFGKGLADFLNGLINPRLFGDVGKTIASSLNTAIYSLNSFGKTFEFDEFGNSIAEGINEFFGTFDFNELADTLNTWADGIWDTIVNIIAGIEWGDVFEGIIETLSKLDIDTVLTISWFAFGQKTAISAIGNLLKKEVETNLGTLTVSKILGISITTAIIGFKIGNWLYDHFPTIQEWADGLAKWLFDGKDTINIGKTLTVALGTLVLTIGAVKLGAAAISGITGAITSAITTAGTSSVVTAAATGAGGTAAGSFLSGFKSTLGKLAVAGFLGNETSKLFNKLILQPLAKDTEFEEYYKEYNSGFKGIIGLYDTLKESENPFKELHDATKLMWEDFKYYAFGPTEELTGAFGKIIEVATATNLAIQGNDKGITGLTSKVKGSIVTIAQGTKKFNNFAGGIDKATVEFKHFADVTKNEIRINATNENAEKTIDDTKNTLNTFVNSFKPTINLGADASKVTKTKENTHTMLTTFINDFKPNVDLGVDTSSVGTAQNSVRSTLTSFTSSFQPSVFIGANTGSIYNAQNNVRTMLTTFVNSFQPSVKIKADTSSAMNSVNTLAEKIKSTIRNGITAGVSIGASAGALGRLNINVRGYAGGGFPDTYSMFMAGERGKAEILGTVGGKTAVAGGQEITGIRDAINSANQREAILLRTMINLLQVIADKDTSISQSDVYNAVRRENRQRYNQTGVNALLY